MKWPPPKDARGPLPYDTIVLTFGMDPEKEVGTDPKKWPPPKDVRSCLAYDTEQMRWRGAFNAEGQDDWWWWSGGPRLRNPRPPIARPPSHWMPDPAEPPSEPDDAIHGTWRAAFSW